MTVQEVQDSVEKMRAISSAVSMLEGFMNNGMISEEEFKKAKDKFNDKVHSSAKELLNVL